MVLHFDHKDDKSRAVRKGDRQIQMARKNYFEILHLSFDPAESRQRVIDKAVEDWKKFLAAGGSEDPAGLARIAGVDITTDGPLNATIDYIGSLIDEICGLTEEIDGIRVP